ncbi:MAG: ABC transporter ATP-binding protein [Anaerolineae bacterium]|nr:ABC transporter ATP-binding protein [Promineifilum sp.]MCZ2113243.1 ABC transporter ATP-binding protein [Anaerolineae bacterium]HNS38928.1 ABC transporter ATP-binding protein [Promineifilum sp.]
MTEQLPVRLVGITKRFPGVVANDGVDLDLRVGEVHGLLGENGAGKSTLMNILFGLYTPEEGQIFVNGQPVIIDSPAKAISLGIGMIHQHFRLVRPFTVTENIILGLDSTPAILDMKAAATRVAQVARQYGIQINPNARIENLSVGEQQRVEILNSLYREANVLILDEPTAVLTPQEAQDLAVTLREMASQGKAVVFISHKLDEVMDVTDRVTVLRRGRKVFEAMTADTSKGELAREMIGHKLEEFKREQKAFIMALTGAGEVTAAGDGSAAGHHEAAAARPVLTVQNLVVNDDRDLPACREVSFEIAAGEILGVAGVDGNGQRELIEALTGQRPALEGHISVNGKDATRWTPRQVIDHDVAVITDDRQGEGLLLKTSVARNTVLKLFERPAFAKRRMLRFGAIDSFAEQLVQDYSISTPGVQVAAAKLSGGNQQKIILARELSQSPALIIANKPTRGLDIGAATYVHQKLSEERDRGAAVLLISADLDELFALSDRLMVIYSGRVMGIMPIEEADLERVGLMMAGTSDGGRPTSEQVTP